MPRWGGVVNPAFSLYFHLPNAGYAETFPEFNISRQTALTPAWQKKFIFIMSMSFYKEFFQKSGPGAIPYTGWAFCGAISCFKAHDQNKRSHMACLFSLFNMLPSERLE